MYSTGEQTKFIITERRHYCFKQHISLVFEEFWTKSFEPAHTGNILQSLQHPPEQICDLENRGGIPQNVRTHPLHYMACKPRGSLLEDYYYRFPEITVQLHMQVPFYVSLQRVQKGMHNDQSHLSIHISSIRLQNVFQLHSGSGIHTFK